MLKNGQNHGNKGKIAWVVPGPITEGSGGHNTIFRHADYLIKNGYTCDLYVKNEAEKSPKEIYNDICKWYGEIKADVSSDVEHLEKKYELAIATGWDTAEIVKKISSKEKLYFIQDYEPWFYGMGDKYLDAEKSYKYGFRNASIGKWLPIKLRNKFGIDVSPFSFGARLDIYHRDESIKKENAICFIYQPAKARRCADWGIEALKIVHKLKPEVKIYLYGSPKMVINKENVQHLGIIKTEECNKLYNKCKVGLCLSSSNPSRIPFEMMAAGLPVVDLYLENNLYDFPEEGCLLAEPNPKAIAAAILRILDDAELRKKLSEGGENYMKEYSQDRELQEFKNIIDKIINNESIGENRYDRKYKRVPVGPIEYDEDLNEWEMMATDNNVELELRNQINELNVRIGEYDAALNKMTADFKTISDSTAFKIGKKITWLPHKIMSKLG